MREEIYNAFDIYTLIEFALNLKKFDVISVKVLNHLITRKFEDQDKAFLFILLPINKEVYNYIIFRREIINDSCLILYSIRSNTQIVEKGTPLEDPYVEELFQLDVKFNYEILFDYKVTKRALTKSLMASIHAKNIDAVNFLISKGVPVNIIIDSQTPLQYSISQSFIPGIEALLNHGASLEFNGTQTAAVCAEISQNADIIKLICSKINIKYECLFSDIRKIHVSKINQSSIPPLKEDIIKSVNIINSNKQSSFGLSLNFINNNNSFPDEIIFGMFRNLVIGKRDNTNLFNTIKSEMLIGKTFNNPLRIITMFAPVDLTSIQHLFAHQIERRDGVPVQTRQEVWNFILNNINDSSPYFKAAYSVITGVNMIEPVENLSDLLYLATRLGNIEIITALLDKGAQIEDVEGIFNRMSPSLEAISKDRSDILELFILHGLKFDHIYSIDKFTLLNASIEFNSTKCFDLLFSQTSFGHFVVETPMMSALQTFERTDNDYFINKLLPQIDTEYERIVDSSFCDYLLFKSGQIPEFHYNSAKRPLYKVRGDINSSRLFSNLIRTNPVQIGLIYELINNSRVSEEINQKFLEIY